MGLLTDEVISCQDDHQEGQKLMNDQLKERLSELKVEYEAGQKLLLELEAKQVSTQQTLLRISGAIQVLEELLSQTEGDNKNGAVTETAVPATTPA